MNGANGTNDTLIFGGWAVPPDILKCAFGGSARYADVNKIMPELFDGGKNLNPRWIDIISSSYKQTKPETIVGWSTGAMFAYALARAYPPHKLILLSATPSFCRRDDFRPGTRPAVIDAMIAALAQDRDAVLGSFYERCGLRYDTDTAGDTPHGGNGRTQEAPTDTLQYYTTEELTLGLRFLKHADLRPLAPLPETKILFKHGRADVIIPPAASAHFHERVGGTYELCDGGHAFFAAFSR